MVVCRCLVNIDRQGAHSRDVVPTARVITIVCCENGCPPPPYIRCPCCFFDLIQRLSVHRPLQTKCCLRSSFDWVSILLVKERCRPLVQVIITHTHTPAKPHHTATTSNEVCRGPSSPSTPPPPNISTHLHGICVAFSFSSSLSPSSSRQVSGALRGVFPPAFHQTGLAH